MAEPLRHRHTHMPGSGTRLRLLIGPIWVLRRGAGNIRQRGATVASSGAILVGGRSKSCPRGEERAHHMTPRWSIGARLSMDCCKRGLRGCSDCRSCKGNLGNAVITRGPSCSWQPWLPGAPGLEPPHPGVLGAPAWSHLGVNNPLTQWHKTKTTAPRATKRRRRTRRRPPRPRWAATL